MRRLPLVPTLFVAAAVAAMIQLGIWQLRRADEKQQLLAEYASNAAMPALDLDPLLARAPARLPPLAFRRVLVTCRAERAEPTLRGGSSRDGQGGWVYHVPCRPGASGLAGRLRVNAGWTRLPDNDLRLSLSGITAGTLGTVREDQPIVITAATAAPPLAPSAGPRIEDVPNNHLFYAWQWFSFAAAAVVIYLLAWRRLSAERRRLKSRP